MLRKISTFCNQSTNFAVVLRQAQQVGLALKWFLILTICLQFNLNFRNHVFKKSVPFHDFSY